MELFIISHHNYNYDELFSELEKILKKESEGLE